MTASPTAAMHAVATTRAASSAERSEEADDPRAPEGSVAARSPSAAPTAELELCELAPGIDLERDVLPHMGFAPARATSGAVRAMRTACFEQAEGDAQ